MRPSFTFSHRVAHSLARTRALACALACALVAVLSLASPPAAAQAAAPAAGAKPAADLTQRLRDVLASSTLQDSYLRNGRKVASFCANCHGEGGNSVSPDIPNLAGQNPVYLLEQVRQFGDGRRRNEFMQGLIKAMSDDEKLAVAVYFASQTVVPRPVANATLVARGKAYYDKVCFRCHGERGMGSEQFARIAGQQPAYLAQTIKRYRDGSVTRRDPLMAANTRNMSDDDIAAMVAYVSSMR